jgi:antitoxin PrlF
MARQTTGNSKDTALHVSARRPAIPVIEEVCTITAKGQTTVPKAIRQALGVSYGGRITFRVENGTVSVHVAEPLEDPALTPFLALLECDIAGRPDALVSLTPDLAARMAAATEGAAVDPDAPIEGEVAL